MGLPPGADRAESLLHTPSPLTSPQGFGSSQNAGLILSTPLSADNTELHRGKRKHLPKITKHSSCLKRNPVLPYPPSSSQHHRGPEDGSLIKVTLMSSGHV